MADPAVPINAPTKTTTTFVTIISVLEVWIAVKMLLVCVRCPSG